MAVLAAVFLTACQTASGVSRYSLENKPTVLTNLSLPEARAKAKAKEIFTRPTRSFHVTSETSNRILFSKIMPASINDNNRLKERTKSDPLLQLELTFRPEHAKTRVTADIWMFLNPHGADKDKFHLLQAPDGRRVLNRLNEMR